MATRYQIKSRRSVLSAAILTKTLVQSNSCALVETRVINLSNRPCTRTPKKIISMYDEDTEIVGIYTHGQTHGEAKKIYHLSSTKLEGVARNMQECCLSGLISCLSANSVFISKAKHPDRSRFIYCYQPRHGLNKICKGRLVIVESVGLSLSDQTTSVKITRMPSIASGCLLKLDLVGQIREGEGTVTFNYDGRNYTLKARFAESLDGLAHPLPDAILELMKYDNFCATHGEAFAIERFAAYAGSSLPSSVIWSILQKTAILGNIGLLQNLSTTLATRLNSVVKDGIVAVQLELGL